MTYKTILLHLSDDDAAETRRAHAAALARRFDAKLVGLALAAPAHPLTLASPEAMGEVWAEISAQSDERADALRTRFAEAMSADGVRFEARAARAPGLAADAFALHARYADLSVLASPAAAGSPAEREERDQAIRGALFESGRPVLLLPETGLPDGRAREALIAWDGRKEAARALRDALPLLADVEGAEVCTVETLFDDGPDNDGASLAASEYLAAHGVTVDANTLNRSFGIASALSERARERGSDLLVMGGYGHSRLSEAIFGGVTETLLRESPIPIFMAH